MVRAFAIVLAVFCLSFGTASAVVPTSITIQGKLTDAGGLPPAPGPQNLGFRIFDAPVAGTQVWPLPAPSYESQMVTTNSGGLWIALLGAINPLDDSVFADTVRWLEITHSPGGVATVLPRVRLVSGSFAFRVATVDGASGGTITSRLTVGPGNTNTGDDAFVAGSDNSATGQFDVVLGRNNTGSNTASTIGGGAGNSAAAQYGTIAGGGSHSIIGGAEGGTIGGGYDNGIAGMYATVAGGSVNQGNGQYSGVGGGLANLATGQYSTIAGGDSNWVSSTYATIGGGKDNSASGSSTTIGGGAGNDAQGQGSVISGGTDNRVVLEGQLGTISGGTSNWISAQYGTIGGGFDNLAGDSSATIAGGYSNQATGTYSSVGGGRDNSVSGLLGTVAGGGNNSASIKSTVGGGEYNNAAGQHSTVSGGYFNGASGLYSTVAGGYTNSAIGNYSFAAGRAAHANAEGTFVWADATSGYDANISNTFNVRAANGLLMYANNSGYGAYLSNAGIGDGMRIYSNTSQGTNWAALYATNSGNGSGIWATSSSGYAGYFSGSINVTGTVVKGGGGFKIDHPLDPENKYLYHSFVESPDMKNIYDGVATLDAQGEASIDLPEWFGALNRDFRYQLTCIGGYAPVYIADTIVGNRFRIAGGRPGLAVSWQVTGIRQDAFANANRIPVEEPKEAKEKGLYIHPAAFGKSSERGLDFEAGKQ